MHEIFPVVTKLLVIPGNHHVTTASCKWVHLARQCHNSTQGPELDETIDVLSPSALYKASEPSGKEFLGQLRLISLCSASRVGSVLRDNILLSSYNGKPMATACITCGSLWPIDGMGYWIWRRNGTFTL